MTRTIAATAFLFTKRRRGRQLGQIGMSQSGWRWLFATSVIVLLSQMWLPDARPPIGMPSGLAHILGFQAVSTFALLARPQSGIRLLIALALLALVVEGGQWFVPTRTVDALDLTCNLLGIALAWLQRGVFRFLH